jgi:hypothetical protein
MFGAPGISKSAPNFIGLVRQDKYLEVGMKVSVRWTAQGDHFSESGEIVKLNTKSLRVALTDDVLEYDSYEEDGVGRVLYTKGCEIRVPRILSGEWGWGNRVEMGAKDAATVIFKETGVKVEVIELSPVRPADIGGLPVVQEK